MTTTLLIQVKRPGNRPSASLRSISCICHFKTNREMFDSDNHSNGLGLSKYKKLNGKKGLLTSLKTSETHGIASDDSHLMADRMNAYGTNAARPVKIKTLWELVKAQLDDTTMKILIAATFVSLSIGIWRDLEAYYARNTIVFFSTLRIIGI